ncbi:TetR/AcrR family transcriptional regulator [Streptomyces sp. KS_5]|uniref:TetR/AcrR family transcriptional regulator n=1 Tax=Streptomyces sp. KS_5 TaxID=1881018 RepID=UPI002109EC44|nr:TetR/AcrR family transcriptional regulator [Streptomyces sp. KS_5]
MKGKLIDAAEDVFRRQGFSGASVQDITTAAGVPKGSFYNHFASKQVLTAEIMRRYVSNIDLSALRDDQLAPVERLRAHLTSQIDRTESTGVEFGCLIGTLASDGPTAGDAVRSEVAQGLQLWTDALAEAVRTGQQTGDITTAKSAEVLAAFLIDALQGSALRAKATGNSAGVLETLDAILFALRP